MASLPSLNSQLPAPYDMGLVHSYTSVPGRIPTKDSTLSPRQAKRFDPRIYNRRIINFEKGITDLADWRDRIDEIDRPIPRKKEHLKF